MKKEELRELIDNTYLDITFLYKGIYGIIMPESSEKFIIAYSDVEEICTNADEVMEARVLDGKSLNDVITEVQEIECI